MPLARTAQTHIVPPTAEDQAPMYVECRNIPSIPMGTHCGGTFGDYGNG